MGPCSSALELHAGTPDQSHLARTRQPEPPLTWRLLVGWPAVVAVHVASWVPWLLALWFLVAPVLREVVEEDEQTGGGGGGSIPAPSSFLGALQPPFPYMSPPPSPSPLHAPFPSLFPSSPSLYSSVSPPAPPPPPDHRRPALLHHPPPPPRHLSAIRRRTWHGTVRWFMVPERLALYFLLRVMHKVLVPWVQLGAVVAVKRLVVGAFKPMTAADPLTDWELTRRWIMRALLPTANLCGVLPLVGTHYETISCVFRALGAKVGARVFWPGSGVYIADGAFDLLEVGDDAVWGSRSLLFPANALHALPIKIGYGWVEVVLCSLSHLLYEDTFFSRSRFHFHIHKVQSFTL